MTFQKQLLCFLLVITPIAGITIATRNKAKIADEKPVQRRINWDPACAPGQSCGGRNNAEIAGIMNMVYIFRYLLALGRRYNATTHIKGGINGADLHLEPRHSDHTNTSWAHYFDVTANQGNPFHDIYEGEECKEIWDKDINFYKLFQNGETCLTFRDRFDHYTGTYAADFIKWYKPMIEPSAEVVQAAKLVQKKLPANYGVIHIRRCDRLIQNRECTAINKITERVQQADPVDAWMVFSYAEPGYDELLESQLQQMGQKAFFERDVSFALNPNQDNDNYFSYWVTDYVMQSAKVLVNTHNCQMHDRALMARNDLPEHMADFVVKGKDHPDKIVGYSRVMSNDMAESKARCTWKPGDPNKAMPTRT